MRQIHQLEQFIDQIPPWGQFLIALFLLVFSILSLYGRYNTKVGSKVFSKIPADQIRSNWGHIIGYTIIPIIVTVGYFVLLAERYL